MTRGGKRSSARGASKRSLFAGRKRISARAADRIEIAGSRRWLVGGILLLAYVAVMAKAGYLHLYRSDFLEAQGDRKSQTLVEIPASRGMIFDRNGEVLAVSTPMVSIYADGVADVLKDEKKHADLAKALDLHAVDLRKTLREAKEAGRVRITLKREIAPQEASDACALGVRGLRCEESYRRFYPAGETTGQLVGYTDHADQGQAGIEYAYNRVLSGEPGQQRVVRDPKNRVIDHLEVVNAPRPGQSIQLTVDRRLQYLAWRALSEQMKAELARSGAAVVLDARSGEVLAMVSAPTFNPNDRAQRTSEGAKNRALMDPMEPGSTIKPFTVAAGLRSGKFSMQDQIETSPGYMPIGGGYTVKEYRNKDYGTLDLAGILKHSSNVGAAKIALGVEREELWDVLHEVGFGQGSGSGIPGEERGLLRDPYVWTPTDQATMGYGYGLNVTLLQLARAYAVIANDGVLKPVQFVHGAQHDEGHSVLSAKLMRNLREAMTAVTEEGGTAKKAAVTGYRIAGKTGTARNYRGGYVEGEYRTLFAGMAPADQPRFVVAVMLEAPQGNSETGGAVAAPVFSKIMSAALRLYGVVPDAERHSLELQLARVGGRP